MESDTITDDTRPYRYEASSLDDVAEFFQILASDTRAMLRLYRKKSDKVRMQTIAETYMECAEIITATRLVEKSNG